MFNKNSSVNSKNNNLFDININFTGNEKSNNKMQL